MKGETLIFIGIAIIVAGLLLTFLGTALLSSGKNNKEDDNPKVTTGGVILIGPIPIIFGNDKNFTMVAIVGAIILMVIAYFLFYRGAS